jgi:hypothetical protein
MTIERIEKVLEQTKPANTLVRISFKKRSPVQGVFIKTSDFSELSRKNLWRVVNEVNVSSYNQSNNESLARIFNGTEFTKLELLSSKQ